METLVFGNSLDVVLATNTFRNTPIIIQYDETPLMEVIKNEDLTKTTQFKVWGPGKEDLGRIRGTRFFLKGGADKRVSLKYPRDMVIAELDGKPMFEIKRIGPAAIATVAELYTPSGQFIRVRQDGVLPLLDSKGTELKIGGIRMTGCTFDGCRIAILLQSNGAIGIGCN